MILKFYKLLYLTILLFLSSSLIGSLSAQCAISGCGNAMGSASTSISPDSDLVQGEMISVTGTFPAPSMGESISCIEIKYASFNTDFDCTVESNITSYTPPGGNTFTFDYNLSSTAIVTNSSDPSVCSGDAMTASLIQVRVLYSDGSCLFKNAFVTVEAAMPVELTSFKGNETQKTNTLNWQTAAEINNDYFEIERSVDGRDFEVIGMEEGNGTTTLSSHYRFIDRSPLITGYYRLRQVDFDGAFEYSDIIMVKREDHDAKHDLIIYPNPVKDNMKIEYQTAKSQESTVSVMNMTGQILSVQIVTSQEGRNILDLNSADFPTGSYILRIDLGDKLLSKLFIK